MARVRAMLRRTRMTEVEATETRPVLRINDLEVDIDHHRASLRGSTLNLSPKEFNLLAFLAQNKGFVFSREQLLDRV